MAGQKAKRFPEDGRPWFRVTEDILDDPKLIGLGREGLGIWIALLAMLNRQKSHDGTLRISINGVEALTGKRRRDVAETWLQRLADVGLTSWQRDGDVYEITVSKWSDLQGFDSGNKKKNKNKKKTPPSEVGTSASDAPSVDLDEVLFDTGNGHALTRSRAERMAATKPFLPSAE